MRWIRRTLYVFGILGFSNLAAAACMAPHMVSANGAGGLLLGLVSLALLGSLALVWALILGWLVRDRRKKRGRGERS